MFLYRGIIKLVVVRNNPKLVKAIQRQYNQIDAVPIELNVELTHFKKEDDLFWDRCVGVEDLQETQNVYDSIWGQYVIPGMFNGEGLKSITHLHEEEDEMFYLDLTRKVELTFETVDIDLPTKTLKNGQLLCNQTVGRTLYLINPDVGKLISVAYV